MPTKDQLREALEQVLASAHPHPELHPAMYRAWQHAREVLALATPDTMPQVEVGDVIEWKAGHERVFQRLRTSIGAESWNTSLRDKLLGVYRPLWQRKE